MPTLTGSPEFRTINCIKGGAVFFLDGIIALYIPRTLTFKNRGELASRYIFIYLYTYIFHYISL